MRTIIVVLGIITVVVGGIAYAHYSTEPTKTVQERIELIALRNPDCLASVAEFLPPGGIAEVSEMTTRELNRLTRALTACEGGN